MSPHLDEIQKFCTYTHSIQKLNHYKFKKLAVVGTPCQIYTVRCMQDLGVTPSQNIEICLGLFCYENFLFDKSQIEKFERDFNVSFENIEKINIKQDLIFRLKDEGTGEKIVNIPFNQIEKYMRPACRACNDFTNIFSDISFGGLSSPDKYTTVITRTKKGEEIFSKALNAGIIRALNIDKAQKTEMIKLISQFSQSKIERKNIFMEKLK
jgi:coenzyme F420 hydrogenase subunit beta